MFTNTFIVEPQGRRRRIEKEIVIEGNGSFSFNKQVLYFLGYITDNNPVNQLQGNVFQCCSFRAFAPKQHLSRHSSHITLGAPLTGRGPNSLPALEYLLQDKYLQQIISSSAS